MDKLPIEISEKIFQSIHQRDKVECMGVCRSWKKAIERTILCSTVRLQSEKQLYQLVAKLRREPRLDEKVRRLIIEINQISISNIDILPLILYNLSELVFYGELQNDKLPFTSVLEPHPWTKTIKFIREASSNILVNHILKGGICFSLTEIQVNGGKEKSGEELVTLLINAPNLLVLDIWNYDFALINLETLHSSALLLRSLSLNDSIINSDNLPAKIEPATHLKTLKLNKVHTSTTEKYIDFQKYLTKKYQHVNYLVYQVYVSGEYNRDVCMNRGFAPYIKQLGPNLTSLELLNHSIFQYVFPILDGSNCQIKKFSTTKVLHESKFQQIVQSNQAQYIQTLSLHNISYSTIKNNFTKLTALTELSLTFGPDRADVSMSTLMSEIGNALKTFELSYAIIELDPPTVASCPELTSLKLKNCEMPFGTDFFISQAFPKLRTLTIDDCTWNTSTFYLGDLGLSNLEIRTQLPSDQDHILIITLCNNEKRWYTTNKPSELNPYPSSDPSTCPAVKSLCFDEFKGLPYITIVLNSLASFFMVNTFAP